jgi:hypothetical protein
MLRSIRLCYPYTYGTRPPQNTNSRFASRRGSGVGPAGKARLACGGVGRNVLELINPRGCHVHSLVSFALFEPPVTAPVESLAVNRG